MKSTYLISYKILDNKEKLIKEGKIKVHNKSSSIEAQVELEKYLKRKNVNMSKMIVKECKIHNDIMDTFNSIFGSIKNPF